MRWREGASERDVIGLTLPGVPAITTGSNGGGWDPAPGLVEGGDGWLYGTTSAGGGIHNAGTVFKLNKDGTGYRVLHSFPSTPGWGIRTPNVSGLVTDRDGVLYGTTAAGGVDGAGDLFKLDPHGSGYEVLHDFDAEDDEGFSPRAALLLTSDGLLYGTTYSGGGTDGRGTVFRLSTTGTGYTIVQEPQGGYSITGLVQGTDGALYGTTIGGVDLGLGTVFALRPRPVMHPPIPGPHSMTVRFGSMPRSIHQLQRAGALDGTWQTLETLVVPHNGVAEFVDPEPPRFGAFYRTLTP